MNLQDLSTWLKVGRGQRRGRRVGGKSSKAGREGSGAINQEINLPQKEEKVSGGKRMSFFWTMLNMKCLPDNQDDQRKCPRDN